MLNLDVGTLSGVIGVFLTIIFFMIGYRQTIGARKERAAAANREIIETLLRRFILEGNFRIEIDGIHKFLLGKAIEHRIQIDDLYSISEFEGAIFGRILESDLITPENRRIVSEKIVESFKVSKSSTIDENKGISKYLKSRIRTTRILATASALFGAVASIIFSMYEIKKTSAPPVGMDSIIPMLSATLALIIITSLFLAYVSRLKERGNIFHSGIIEYSTSSEIAKFEEKIATMLLKKGFKFIEGRGVDFIIRGKNGLVGVETQLSYKKQDANMLIPLLRSNKLHHLYVVTKKIRQNEPFHHAGVMSVLLPEEFEAKLYEGL